MKGDLGFKRTENIPWEMIGTIRADGVAFSVRDRGGFQEELFKVALSRDLNSLGAIENKDPHKVYPVLVKRSSDANGNDTVHHVMISFDSGEVKYAGGEQAERMAELMKDVFGDT